MASGGITPPTLDIPLSSDQKKLWKKWRQKFESYLLVAGLAEKGEELQIAALVTGLNSEALDVYNSLEFASESDRKKLDKTLELMENHYVGELNIVYERHLFFRRNQGKDERFQSYLTSVRALAATCDFKALRDEMIRDRIVCGIANVTTQRQLLQKKNLTLAGCIELCQTAETTAAYVERMNDTAEDHETTEERYAEVLAMRTAGNRSSGANMLIEKCMFCGRTHRRRECPAFGMSCHKCGKKNHFAASCRSARLDSVKYVAFSNEKSHTADLNEASLCVNTLASKDYPNKITTNLVLDDHLVKFQVDSGATCDVVRLKDLNVGKESLQASSDVLQLYDTSKLTPLGRWTTELFNPKTGIRQRANLIVVEDAPTAILGAATSQKLGLLTVHYDNIYSTTTERPGNAKARNDLIQKFQAVFSEELGEFDGEINLEVDPSVPAEVTPLRRVPLAVQDRLEAELLRLEDIGVLKRVTTPTKWVSGMVVAEKKDSQKIRLCIDPKPLNRALKRSLYPLPTLEDVLPKLAKAKVFSVCDLRNGFWHCKLDEESSMLTTFNTPHGRFRWTRLPFGVAPAPEIFQRKLAEQLEGLEGLTMIAEDILIFGQGETEEEALINHDKNLEMLLQRAKQRGIRINEGKFKYRLSEVCYVGHILSHLGVRADPKKTEAICRMPPPDDVAGVRRFLGMANYLGKFLKDMASVCEPLRQLTRQDVQWDWSHEHARAFDQVKRKIASTPILTYFDPGKATKVQCDASQHALGAALMQKDQVIAFASRSLSDTEKNYAQIEKELLAIVFALEKFDQYVYGRHVTVETDHKPLLPIMKKAILLAPKRLQRMLLQLQRYDISLIYQKGTEMHVADTLSRAVASSNQMEQSVFERELETVCAVATKVDDVQLEEIRRETMQDTTLQAVAKLVMEGWPADKRSMPAVTKPYFNIRDEMVMDNGILFKGDRCIIPAALRRKMLHRVHEAHMGVEGCLRRARETIFWPGINQQIKDFVQQCDTCQTFGPRQQKETMIPHPVVEQPWIKTGADLFSFDGRDYLITVDYFSNYWEIDYLADNTSSSNVINKLRAQFARYGIPRILVTDNGPQFSSRAFKEFAEKWRFEHVTSSPEYPQSNGKVESAVKTAKSIMRRAMHAKTDGWLAILEYRNTPTEDLHSSPVQRFLQRRTRTRLPATDAHLEPELVSSRTGELLEKRQQRQEKCYNQGAKDLPEILEGEPCRVYRYGRWQRAIVVKRMGPKGRSYIIRTRDHKQFRRNRTSIKKDYQRMPLNDIQTNNDNSKPDEPTHQVQVEDAEQPENHSGNADQTQAEHQQPIRHSRYGRALRQPAYLKDYDTSG